MLWPKQNGGWPCLNICFRRNRWDDPTFLEHIIPYLKEQTENNFNESQGCRLISYYFNILSILFTVQFL